MPATSPIPGDPLPGLSMINVAIPAKRGKNGNAPCLLPEPNSAHNIWHQRTGNPSGKHSGNKIGKNGNAARLIVLAHPNTTAARTPEKFSAPITHPTPATFPAKTAMPRTCSHIAHAHHACHTSAHYQIAKNRNSGKNGNEHSGNILE